jgi:predicted NUDIX family phosphoesterase
MTNKMDEQIIVVPRKALFNNETLVFQGTEDNKDIVNVIMSNIEKNFGVMRRGDAEENPNFKQPIPYAVIRRGKELFMYERLSGGGEQRLHGKLSLGAGGHMNYEPADSFEEVIGINLARELEEELDISHSVTPKAVGLINDDSTPVNKVHIALLVILDLPADATVGVRETDQLKGSWITLEELKKEDTFERLEDWSKIVVQTLDK